MNESNIVPQQQAVHYQDLANQVNSMSLDNQNNSARSDLSGQSDKQQHQQLTSPTSPVEVSATSPAEIAAAQRKHVVYYPDNQIQQTGQYQSINGYPVQYFQNVPVGYQNYQLANNSGQQHATTPNNMQPPPSPTTPGLISQHYATANIPSQNALIQPSPEQYLTSVSAQLSGQRPRYPGAMVYPRGSTNQIYVPVAAQPQQLAMYLSGQFANGQKNYDFYRTNRINNSAVDATDFRKIDSQYQQSYAALQQPNLSLAQQHRPLMQIAGNYQQAYYHMSGPPKR